MKWDGKAYADVVKKSVYAILFSTEIPQAATMGNKEYAAFLKSHHYDMGKLYPDKRTPDVKANSSGIKIIFKDRYLDNAGDNSITLTWSMAARHIRAWEYEKAHDENDAQHTLTPVQEQWEKTHLCGGSVYVEGHCEYLIEPTEDIVINGKKVEKCNPYCTSENKVRKIGTGGLWTGLSPKFCPKRKALEQKPIKDEKENKPMARKLQLDAAITKNMKAAASDSFIDNIKMIDFKEIIPSENNFYEMSGIDLLADDIEREGLKHNLVVAKDPSTGLYEVKSGHRRLAAIELLIKEKRINSSIKIPCIVDGDKTEAENEFDLIMLNATQRKYSGADVMHEYEQIERTLKALVDEGKPVKGRMRDNIAKILKVSPAQVGKIENIKHNAVPEVEEAVKGGAMSISTANELAKLPEEKQKEIIKENPNISHTEIKEIQKQEKKPPVSQIAEDDDLDDFDELDELLDDDDLDDEREVKPEKKNSLVLSLILSEDEAKTLLRFFYRFGGDYGAVGASDTAELREIESKLKILCGKD